MLGNRLKVLLYRILSLEDDLIDYISSFYVYIIYINESDIE